MKQEFIDIINENLKDIITSSNFMIDEYEFNIGCFYKMYDDPIKDDDGNITIAKGYYDEEVFNNLSDTISYVDNIFQNPPKLQDEDNTVLSSELCSLDILITYLDKLQNNATMYRTLISLVKNESNEIETASSILIPPEMIISKNILGINEKLSNLKSQNIHLHNYYVSLSADCVDIGQAHFIDFDKALEYYSSYLTHLNAYYDGNDTYEIDYVCLSANYKTDDSDNLENIELGNFSYKQIGKYV